MMPILRSVLAELTGQLAQAGGPTIEPDQLLRRDVCLGLGLPGRWSPNRRCRLVATRDGWLAVNLARAADVDTVPAWLETVPDMDPWTAVDSVLPTRATTDLLARAILLHLPVTRVGEAMADWPVLRHARPRAAGTFKVVDLSALWAGPLAGGLLAAAGADVVKVESSARPDPTSQRTPVLDRWLNGGKRRVHLALASRAVQGLIDEADVLITAGRPHALARAGLTPERLFSANPGLLWIAITAHGWMGDAGLRVGFGDDCAAAGGLLGWDDGAPRFLGDALADPCTGLIAAVVALEARRAGQGGLLDVSLGGSAAWIAGRLAEREP
ncbi:CoA transferase [Nitrospirillum iridis]|uniref:CoA transferase n=1 Tax=Nitrospirillum iridis TaxID=765888 RepID=A0A7X0EE10_9PROT|nr:CoA transferase [Nitrospirillum iridis]MBB6253363.1 hypothetical protein [Nitrospirillum iridis]